MKRVLSLLMVLLVLNIIWGAEFKVSGELKEDAMRYIKNNERDSDGEYCALIVVNSDIRNLRFDSNRKPIKTESQVGHYEVYLSPGERYLIFSHGDFATYKYQFPVTLKSNTAYEMTVIQSGYTQADEGLVTITFELNENDVYIANGENPPILCKQKSTQFSLSPGSYDFRFYKQGYEDVLKQLSVEKDELIKINIAKGISSYQLKLPGIVIIASDPEGAEVYLNDQKMGKTPNQYELIAGEYILTLKANLHHSKQQEFSLIEGATKDLGEIKLLPKYGFWEVNTHNEAAEIYLDDVFVTKGKVSRQKIESGNHKLTVKLDYYHDHEEDFTIKDGDDKSFAPKLKPAFGELVINSTPVRGADVYINGKLVGTTPYRDNRCKSGQYQVKVEMDLYNTAEEKVVVNDEELTEKTILLNQNFGVLKVTAAESEIYVNGTKVGIGSYRANLDTGKYLLEARKLKHHSDSREVYLGVGANEEIELNPQPMMGSVTVMTNPPASKGAEIWVNGSKEKKTSPAVLPLLIGEYEIKVEHPDFLELTKPVSLREGEQKKLEFDLKTYQGSMLSQRNKWRTNAWLGAGLTVLSLGAGIYFNSQGDDYADDYVLSADITAVEKNYDDMDSSYQKRDLCFYVSAAPAVYWLYSWIKSGYYGSKIEKK